MKKKNLILLLVVGTLAGAMLTGCGQSNETIENDISVEATEAPTKEEGIGMVDQITGDETEVNPTETPVDEPTEEPTAEPTETPVVEPTETPVPTEEPVAEPTETPEPTEAPVVEEVKADWLAENGYTVNGAGAFSYDGLANYCDTDLNKTLIRHEITGEFATKVFEREDGTRTIAGVIATNVVTVDDSWSGRFGHGFVVDRYTGTAYFIGAYKRNEPFSVTLEDGTEINMIVNYECRHAESADGTVFDIIQVNVPVDYDGLVFGMLSFENDTDVAWGTSMSISELPLAEGCELIFFAE